MALFDEEGKLEAPDVTLVRMWFNAGWEAAFDSAMEMQRELRWETGEVKG